MAKILCLAKSGFGKTTSYCGREKLGIKESMNFTDLQNVEDRVKNFCGEKVYGNADIEDFINSYANADFVVTDSFHGTCLAIVFNKPFISIANKDGGEKRVVSLLKGLNLLDRLVYSVDEIYEIKTSGRQHSFKKLPNDFNSSRVR